MSIFLFSNIAYCDEVKDDEEYPPNIGNFSVPSTQQPGSLVAFGENIYDKGSLLTNLLPSYVSGSRFYYTLISPNIIYSLTDSSSVLLSVPYYLKNKFENFTSSGIGDIGLQYEHAIYQKSNRCFYDQLSIVLNTSLPTGSTKKFPVTGIGAPYYSAGFAFLRTYTDWIIFTSVGVTVTSSGHGVKFGNEFIYDVGFGRNIAYVTDGWILNWVLEFDGVYYGKNKIDGIKDPNSGGNEIVITPSLWFSNKHLIVQFGVGKYLVQHLFGDQRKAKYQILGNLAWSF